MWDLVHHLICSVLRRASSLGLLRIFLLAVAFSSGCSSSPEDRSPEADGQSRIIESSPKNSDSAIGKSLSQSDGRGGDTSAPGSPPMGDRSEGEPLFTEITGESGVHFTYSNGRSANEFAILESLGGGVAMLDADRDGRIDLFFAGGGDLQQRQVSSRPSALFRNLGAWKFVRVTAQARARADAFFTHGVYHGDMDNDGFDDLAISGYGGVQLLKNMGDGTFMALPPLQAGNSPDWSSGLAWADLDSDGFLDLYTARYVDWSWDNHPVCPGKGNAEREVCAPREFSGLSDIIYWNAGEEDGFKIDPDRIVLREGGKGLGVVVADLNQDNQVDIYVANDTTDNFLYLSESGQLRERAVLSGVSGDDAGVSTGSMGICVLDANLDQLPDLFVTNFERELSGLYRNDENGYFTYASRQAGFAAYEAGFVGFGTVAVDFNGDGAKDLVVANGHVSYASPHAPYRQLPLAFENQGGERFRRLSLTGYFATPHTGRGLAAGDLDSNGVLDLAVSHLEEPVSVLRSAADPPQSWVNLRLIGVRSNRSAIGASILVKGPEDFCVSCVVPGGGSYLSSNDRRILVSIPHVVESVQVTVNWPNSGSERFKVATGVESVLLEGTAPHSERVKNNL